LVVVIDRPLRLHAAFAVLHHLARLVEQLLDRRTMRLDRALPEIRRRIFVVAPRRPGLGIGQARKQQQKDPSPAHASVCRPEQGAARPGSPDPTGAENSGVGGPNRGGFPRAFGALATWFPRLAQPFALAYPLLDSGSWL